MLTRSLWIAHLITLTSIVLWAMFDLQFETWVGPLRGELHSPPMSIQTVVDSGGMARTVCFGIIVLLAFATITLIGVRCFGFYEQARSRSIASMLALTAIVACWFSLAINYPLLGWHGKRIRIAIQLSQLELITQSLWSDWPERDGNLPVIGPFMAYPFDRPTTLLLLQSPSVSGDSLCIAAIERQVDGAILLQLSGSPHDDWAEWHPPASRPQSFVGGLCDSHELESSASLGNGWHLVRYHPVHTTRPTW